MPNTCGKCTHWNQMCLGSDDGKCQASLPAWSISGIHIGNWQKYNSAIATWCSTFTPRNKVKTLEDVSPGRINSIAVRIQDDLTNLLNYSFLTKEHHDEIWARVSAILGPKDKP